MITLTSAAPRGRVAHAAGVLEGRAAVEPEYQAAVDGAAAALDQQGFTGKTGQVATILRGGTTLILVGLGGEASADSLRSASGALARSLGTAPAITTSLHGVGIDEALRPVVEGLLLGGYRFEDYRSEKGPVTKVTLVGARPEEVERAAVPARAQIFARDLINTPPGDKPPAEMADRIATYAGEAGVAVEVWDEKRISAERLRGLETVAAGSHRSPRFVRLSYRPRRARATLALVGKGIVFDSGGLSLKTAEGMETMKTDMSGAAVVAAALGGIARSRVPVRVEGLLPITENMPGGGAARPGDVITYRNQKTAEVLNTDAEGRLVLGDGLILAAELSPDLIVDIATLTGAQRVALGERIGAAFGNRREDVELLVAAGAFAGERFWPMPLPDDYRRNIDSDVADIKNTGGPYGGAIHAALFLREFVGDRPWVHLDIAGPARSTESFDWTVKGGTGFGTRTLIRLAELLAER
jgi:leucyl aminopeptidase